MAQRPVLTSFFALSIAAAAMKVASGPSLPTQLPAGDANAPRAAHASAPPGENSWSERLKKDPTAAGRLAAAEELRQKICGFVQGPASECAVRAGEAAAQPPMYRTTPEVMITLAPDPAHTHLSLQFDREIDGFEDALEDSGWEYQGDWMPWASSGGSSQDSSEFESRQEERLYRSGREQMPGVMLFRPSDREATDRSPKRGPLLVLVVGDSPTTGVVGPQFREALRIFGALSAADAPLHILGPNFTGSGPSLRALLNEARKGTGGGEGQGERAPVLASRSVVAVSGSVSDSRAEHFLPDPRPRSNGEGRQREAADQFVSFGADGEWEMQQTWSFLEQQGHLPAEQIAQLTEDESGFGSLLSKSNLDSLTASSKAPAAADNVGRRAPGVLRLKFPRGISHLRSAYQKNAVWGFGGSSGTGSISLNLDFDEPHRTEDSVPIYAPQQMPVSQEGSMSQVAKILEERQIKAVMVSASDVLDELFVAQFLARQAPNVIVVLRGTDVLFLRSGDGGVSRNVYTVSPWPLISRNASWSKPTGSEPLVRAFSSGDTEAVYMATRYLWKERTDELQDYRPPLRQQDLKDGLSAKGAAERPALWFSAVEHGSFWPIALMNDKPPGGDGAPRSDVNLPAVPQKGQPALLVGEEAGVSQRLLLILAVLLSILHAGKCLNLPMLERLAPRYRTSEEATRRPKLFLQLGISFLGVLMLSLVYEPSAGWTAGEMPWRILFLTGMWVLSLAEAHAIYVLARGWRRPSGSSPAEPHPGVELLQGSIFLLLNYAVWMAIWVWMPASSPKADGMAQFFYFRSRHPLSGASPVFPLLLALNGLALILFSHLHRMNFSPAMVPRLPSKMPAGLNCPDEEKLKPVISMLEWPVPGQTLRDRIQALRFKWLTLALVVTGTAGIALSLRLAPQLLESRALQWMIPLSLFALVVGLLWDLTMAAVLWGRLRMACLVPLESSPLRRGFSSVSGLTWRSLWLMPQNSWVQYRALTRAMEQAAHHVLNGAADRPVQGKSLRRAIREMWRSVESGDMAGSVRRFGEVQIRMAVVARHLLLWLRGSWKRETGLITAADGSAEEGKASPAEAKAAATEERLRSVAEEWVALIYIHYIRLVLVQIRTRLSTAAMLYLLLVWSVTSYPFLNRHILMIGLSVLLGVLAFVIITTYASINRDPILSRTTENEPGKLDFDFYAKTASMVGIPLLGFVASQFPEVSSFLFSWIEPGVSAAK